MLILGDPQTDTMGIVQALKELVSWKGEWLASERRKSDTQLEVAQALKLDQDKKDKAFKAAQEERDRKISRRNARMTIIIAAAGFLLTLAMALLAIYWHHLEKKGVLSQTNTPAVTADAGIPPH